MGTGLWVRLWTNQVTFSLRKIILGRKLVHGFTRINLKPVGRIKLAKNRGELAAKRHAKKSSERDRSVSKTAPKRNRAYFPSVVRPDFCNAGETKNVAAQFREQFRRGIPRHPRLKGSKFPAHFARHAPRRVQSS